MGINVSVSSSGAAKASGAMQSVNNAGKIAKVLTKMSSHNSLARMASAGIYQFPVLLSPNMSQDDAVTIARAHEKQCAQFVVTAYSLYGTMADSKYEDLADFTKKFHSNEIIPTNFKAAKRVLTESNTNVDSEDGDVCVESAIVYTEDSPLLQALSSSTWGISRDQVDMESLNSVYLPYTRTSRIIEEKLASMTYANESTAGVQSFLAEVGDTIDHQNKLNQTDISGGLNSKNKVITTTTVSTQGSKSNDGVKTSKIDTMVDVLQKTGLNAKNEVVRNDKLSALEPTMVNVTITRHGTSSNPGTYMQTLTLGVKAMVRLVRSDLMVANMVEAAKNSNAIFKFIRWTKGEIKFIRDFVFGISEAKAAASARNSVEVKVLKASKKRKSINNISKILDNEVFPTLTIIMTTNEVEQVKNICGVDLSQLYNALRLMNKYYLFGFGIYDTMTQSLQMIYDGDDDFAFTTIATMRSQENKDVNLANSKDVLKMMGRI